MLTPEAIAEVRRRSFLSCDALTANADLALTVHCALWHVATHCILSPTKQVKKKLNDSPRVILVGK